VSQTLCSDCAQPIDSDAYQHASGCPRDQLAAIRASWLAFDANKNIVWRMVINMAATDAVAANHLCKLLEALKEAFPHPATGGAA